MQHTVNKSRSTTRTRRPRLMTGVALASLLASCGSDDDAGTTQASAPVTTPSATTPATVAATTPETTPDTAAGTTAATEETEAPTTDTEETTAATEAETDTTAAAGPADGEPIIIGLANDEGAAVNFPEYRVGAEAAVQYINENGGVNGRPIELIICIADGSPEASVNCANQFVDGGAIAYVAGLEVGSDAALPILESAGIPYVTPTAWAAAQRTDPNAFALHTAGGAFQAATIQALFDAGATNIANFHYNIPTSKASEPLFDASAEKIGVDLFHVEVPVQGADWSAAVASAIANDADALIGYFNETDCTNLVRGARDAGFDGPIGAGSCSDYVAELGEDAVNTISVADRYPSDLRDSAPPEVQDQIDLYVQAMEDAGSDELAGGLARNSFSTMYELGEIMKGIDADITGASLRAELEQLDGFPGFMGPDLNCVDQPYKAIPRHCSAEVIVITVEEGPTRVAGDEFLDMSAFGD